MTDKNLTAAILVIGNEILSGSTQDANIAFIAKRLSLRGIKLAEVRIVRDEEDAIVEGLNALRKKYTYVFTTGGIGPTHDDITSDSVAAAFKVNIDVHAQARKQMEDHYAARGMTMNDARLRMARIPVGGVLINCPATIAPGFQMENVYVMAGVPKIMQAQFDEAEKTLKKGAAVLAVTVRCNQKEGDIASELGDIQKRYKDIDIGSYPHMNETPSLSLILRGTDETTLKAAAGEVAAMVRAHGEEPVIG